MGYGDQKRASIPLNKQKNALIRFRLKCKKTGVIPKHQIRTRDCERCKIPFKYKFYPKAKPRRFCSQLCRNIARPCKGQPRKLPAREEVVRLYVEERLPITKIAKMYGACHKSVLAQLNRAGAPIRRHTVAEKCRISRCKNPVQKILHRGNGSLYGTLCAEHRESHRLKLNRNIRRRLNGITPDRFNPWRYKEKENDRIWIRKSKELLNKVRAASSKASISPGVSVLPARGSQTVTSLQM